jgi:imidazolonepropionase-like amidohydrolase
MTAGNEVPGGSVEQSGRNAKRRVWIAIGSVLGLLIVLFGVFYFVVTGTRRAVGATAVESESIPTGTTGTVAFVNVAVIPMDSERVLEGQTVVVNDGRITDLGPSSTIEVPAGVQVVEGEGKFLMPGLSDMHMHLFGAETDLLLYLANGVTTIRDMGGAPPVQLEWRDEINAGTRTGPNILQWSPMFETMDWPDSMIKDWETSGGMVNADDPEKMDSLVADYADQGYDGIKSHVVFATDVFEAVVDSAKKYGLPSDVHVPIDLIFCEDKTRCWESFRSLDSEAVSHVEELTKVVDWSDESIRQAAQDVAADDLWVTTTIALMRSIADQIADLEGELAGLPEVKYVNPGPFNSRWVPGENEYPILSQRLVDMGRPDFTTKLTADEEMLLALYEAGALLLSGSDAPLPLMVPGFSLHDELEVMVDVGLSPFDTLRTSTYNPALYLNNLDEFGTVEPGKRGDLLLLDANPLADITNTRQIAGVMVNGRWYTRADLDAMLDEVAKAYGS